MAGFLYFTPTSMSPSLGKVREWGLGYAFASPPLCREVQGATPNGEKGYVFGDSKRVGDRVKLGEGQTWRKIPGREGMQEVWVGYWNDAKPTPADLARSEQLAGYALKLADGNEWQVPVVRAYDVDAGLVVPLLPTLYDLDDKGQLTKGEIAAAHRWLWDLTEPAWKAMIVEGDMSDQAMLSIAAKLIGANYAVDVVELAAMLQVFSPQLSPCGIVALALDYTTWKEWADAKKKSLSQPPTEDGFNSVNGEAAEYDATPQLALTS